MKTNYAIDMPVDFALVLQQIGDYGVDDFADLSESLRLSKSRLSHIIESLKKKGLIAIENNTYGTWIRLSRRGNKVLNFMWPNPPLPA